MKSFRFSLLIRCKDTTFPAKNQGKNPFRSKNYAIKKAAVWATFFLKIGGLKLIGNGHIYVAWSTREGA